MKRTLALGSLLALALTACQPSQEDPIKIGYLGPLTGDFASAGADTVNAAKMAVEEVNAAGGVNGRMVILIAEDARCTGSDAANAAQKLVTVDKVVGIIGGVCSSETLAAGAIADPAKVVEISPTSSSPEITAAGDFIFRNYPSDALKGIALGKFLQNAKFTKLAVISENTDFCQGIRSSVKDNLPEGTTVVFDEVVDAGTKDYRTLMTRLKNLDFDVFLANGQSDATVAEMAKQMRELGMTQQIVGTDTADSVTLLTLAPDAVEGLKPLSVPSLSEEGTGKQFADQFRAKHGEPQFGMFFAALSYDATKLLLETIGKVGTDGEKIRDALYAHEGYEGVAGKFSFDGNGDVEGIPFAMKEFKGGKLVQSELIPLE
ncbi:MAG: ABC transporter substrate-binding protein [Candidatus Peregrinibacteria bacterium]|nr:ABC transporter substrate-binding protein [Candidatus Peregrinibacteria bacterium]